MPFDEQVHRTFGFIKEALAMAGCGLDDVVNCECWITDPRNFVPFNAIYETCCDSLIFNQRGSK